ncbi:MarR family winged helix-turn-helix transcriptional regulator [Aquihabitans sp. G128]|uniref:MarR family winged helix-turn-helix transcriptional regulator n=1 Tax=Aquihabitans sp. G128 TaxID=2849779 RepID=UPI001C214A83|nr:MarR family winged helix-turn-helix transcriptional regulator [Aquihabitans sp. G128]QXC61560.1 MarR family winged helix-turn-helix transcriptional regulator [Aquihabitans sp. G128]
MPSAAAGADERTVLAHDAWGQIARLFLSQQARREEVAQELGLHISDMISLFHMQPDAGVTQRALAEHWACDPSWVTNRIDRLEQLGLVERRLSAADRRVKEVWLTPAGEKTRTAGMDGFSRPPTQLADLPVSDLRHLAKALAKLDLPDPTHVGMH